MATLLTRNIASMTEMREPHKVLEKSGGEPVAVLKKLSPGRLFCARWGDLQRAASHGIDWRNKTQS